MNFLSLNQFLKKKKGWINSVMTRGTSRLVGGSAEADRWGPRLAVTDRGVG
jgi:hypothetical protein